MTDTINRVSNVLNEYNKRMRELKEQMSQQFQAELKDIFKELFAAYPNVKAIGWTQYTPYFNDGDPCVFSVNDLYVCDEDCSIDDHIYEWKEFWYSENVELYSLIKQTSDILHNAEDILLMMFGDHVKVVATPNGIDVEEYDHD
jgi:hypothetical protein